MCGNPRVKSLNDDSVKVHSELNKMGKGVKSIPKKGTTQKSKEKNANAISNTILNASAIRNRLGIKKRIPTGNISSGSGLQIPS
jgi:hypothetical protein